MTALAFFDFDGTLTRCDTFIPYCLIALLNQPKRIFGLKQVFRGCVDFAKGNIQRQELKEAFVRTFLGNASLGDIKNWNKIFFRLMFPLTLRNKGLKKVRQHKQRGDRIYIVSASPDIYLKPLAVRWGLDGAICTKLEWKNERLTGRILGKNCRGEEKARRVRALFSETELIGSFGYGNSDGDRQLLKIVGFSTKI